MKYAVWGWTAVVAGVAVLVAGYPAQQPSLHFAGSMACAAGVTLVVFGHLDDGTKRRVGAVAWRPARHARPSSRVRTALRVGALYSSAMVAVCWSAIAQARNIAGKAGGEVAKVGRRVPRPAVIGVPAAAAVVATFVVLGLPGVDSGGSNTPALPAEAGPAESLPTQPPTSGTTVPAQDQSPSPSPSPTENVPAVGPRATDAQAAPSLTEFAEAPLDAPAPTGEQPSLGVSPQPDQTREPKPQPTTDPTTRPTPHPTPSPTATPTPSPTPTKPPGDGDKDDQCLLYVDVPWLLELCLLGRS